jgi:hypothetical protein
MKKQPKELLRFIRGVSLTSEGLVAKTDMYPLDDRGIVYPEDLVDTEDETDTSLYMDIEEIVPVGEEDDYVSELYVPVYRVSVLSRMVHSLLLFDRFQEGEKPLQRNTLTYRVLDTTMATRHPNMYILFQAVVLELFSFTYVSREDTARLRFLTHIDIKRLKENIDYLADFCGEHKSYFHLISYLRSAKIAVGYIENQVNVIMDTRVVR